MTTAAIELNQVAKTYLEGEHHRVVFESLSSVFSAGTAVAIVGRSGTGKSTLLNLMSGIDVADDGTVFVIGTDLTRLSETERTVFRRRQIGFVFQAFNLMPTLTVGENLRLPLELLRVEARQADRRVNDMLSRVGLRDRLQSFPDRLSGGEQQRVAVARALVHEPSIVLADEPTGNLDSETGAEVLSLLSSMTRERGKTLIVVTHSNEVARYCDEIRVLKGGALVDAGAR